MSAPSISLHLRHYMNLHRFVLVGLGRVDMQLAGHLCRLVLCVVFISDMGAHRFARHEGLSILRSEGTSV
jgi:hypothetical protein